MYKLLLIVLILFSCRAYATQENVSINQRIDAVAKKSNEADVRYALIKETAKVFLAEKLKQVSQRFDVTAVESLQGMKVPFGQLRLEPRVTRDNEISKRLCVWVDVYVDGNFIRAVPVWFDIHLYQEIWTAKADVARGKKINVSDFTPQLIDVADIKNGLTMLPADITAYRTRKTIVAGKPLLMKDLELTPEIAKEQEVIVKSTQGPIEIETMGVAVEDGKMGQVIKVKNRSSRQVFSATIIGQGIVAAQWR